MDNYKGGNASEVDRISNLPDPLLHLILSGLSATEQVIRSSILSRRWRHLWSSVPSIDIIDYSGGWKSLKTKGFEEFVSKVLANKSIHLDSFRLHCRFYHNMSAIWWWIDVAIRRNVKLLDLNFRPEDEYADIELPRSLLTCGSLEVLSLSLRGYRLSLPKFPCFPALRVLELKRCELFNKELVKYFFKSCPLLEDLTLVDLTTYELGLFCISCPKLKNLRIDYRGRQSCKDGDEYDAFESMCLHLQICCPKLVFLEFAGFMAFEFIVQSLDSLKKVVIHPLDTYEWMANDLCELFGGFAHVESLSLRIFLCSLINLEDLPECLPNLKTLELITRRNAFNILLLVRILIRSPNLESLHLIIQKGPLCKAFPTIDYDLKYDYDCIFERLKMVNMTGISDVPQHMGFIKFLLQRSPFLETMSITPSSMAVLSFPRASPEAEIIFVQDQV